MLGLKRTLRECSARRILAYFIGEYGDRTEEAKHALRMMLKEHPEVALKEQTITFGAPGTAWRMLEKDLGPTAGIGEAVLVDLTTMPREIIWSALFWLEAGAVSVHYVYNRPKTVRHGLARQRPEQSQVSVQACGHAGGWPANSAGGSYGNSTRRDVGRLLSFNEPARVLLAVQSGQQYENNVRNVGPKLDRRRDCDRPYGSGRIQRRSRVRRAQGPGGGTREGPQHHLVLLRPKAVCRHVVQIATRVSANRTGLHRLQGIQPELFGGDWATR